MTAVSEEQFREWKRVAASRLAASLRQLRSARGISQEKVALDAGISVRTYSYLERGLSPAGSDANPTLETILRVLTALEVDPPLL